MSRLTSLSPAALKAMFSTETDAALITLLTIYNEAGDTPVARLADNYLERLTVGTTYPQQSFTGNPIPQNILTSYSEAGNFDLVYGVVSGGNNYIFIPMEISLPSEEDNTAPKCSLTFHDVTRYLTPTIRSLTYPPKIKLELVLTSSPSTVEATFSGFYITNITYNADSVTCELTMTDYAVEPFPCFTFTPQYFPGLF
jgi:hypothetical protein